MKQAGLVIVDYGVGNLFNVQRAFSHFGLDSTISKDPETVRKAERLILPGVGAFETGVSHLKSYGLIPAIRTYAKSGRPLLGICLGMQLLLTESEENGRHRGLDLIPGRVLRFKGPARGRPIFKTPQIGWNTLLGSAASWKDTILDGLDREPYMYFVHSYCVYPKDQKTRLAVTRYGRDEFCSVIRQKNIVGCQFHPERSGDFGLKILENFAKGKI